MDKLTPTGMIIGSAAWQDNQEGRGQATKDIAIKMFLKGYPVQEIAEVTGLTIARLMKFIAKHTKNP